jgi:hypothetical protein
MNNNLIFDYKKIKDTYINFILYVLSITKNLIEETSPWNNLNLKPYNRYDKKLMKEFYYKRSQHILVITLIGLIAEHIVKLILMKRGISIIKNTKNEVKTISFENAIKKFLKSNKNNYFDNIKSYNLSIGDNYEYFGFKQIDPKFCLELIRKSRNSYIHYANPREEKRGVVWYLYNFLIWLFKREFINDIVNYSNYNLDYIGDKEVLECFLDN